jgi:PHD/YefM family antitoxin component YafN of YafNO toxin-antitoxin module
MKYFVNRLVVTLAILAMTATMAFSKTKRDTVTLTENVTVNGTLLKKGTYDVSFNDETNELAIIKNGKVVAKTSAKSEQRSNKASQTELKTLSSNGGIELIGVAFRGADRNIMVERSDAAKN